MSEQKLRLEGGAHQIPAIWQPGAPAVLLVHGTNGSKDDVGGLLRRLAHALAARGVGSLRIDLPGCGESDLPQSACTITSQVADVTTAFRWLSARPESTAVGVLGFSQGAFVTAQATTTITPDVLAVWSPMSRVDDFFTELHEIAKRDGSAPMPPSPGFAPWRFGLEWFETALAARPLTALAAYTKPLFVLAAADDDLTGPAQARELFAHAGSHRAHLRVLSGADHIFNVLTDEQHKAEEAITLTADWLATTLKETP